MADVSERGSCGLNPQGEDIYINCCHPGLVKSDLFREAGTPPNQRACKC